MVRGIDLFKKQFAEYPGQYTLIGGSACDLIFQENGAEFRATRDLDIVLIVEALTSEFGRRFWDFIKAGGYEIRQRSDESPIFYRFQKPHAPGYPTMLELFSRGQNRLAEQPQDILCTRIALGDRVSSLSALLLNDAYYELVRNGSIQIDGVSVLSEPYLLLFKAKAWLDLTERKSSGDPVDSHDIKKHKNDVVRLATILSPDVHIDLSSEVKSDLEKFLIAYEQDPADLRSLGLRSISQLDIMERIRNCFYL